MGHFAREIMHGIDRMGTQQWVLALVALVVTGIFCLRGFGSRSEY